MPSDRFERRGAYPLTSSLSVSSERASLHPMPDHPLSCTVSPMANAWSVERQRWNFWRQVEQGPAGCWLWTGRARENGYGTVSMAMADGRRASTAHRWAYADQVGPIPADFEVDHLCRVRACVRPDHLEPVALRENRRRRDIQYSPSIDTAVRPIPIYERPAVSSNTVARRRREAGLPPLGRPQPTHCKNGHEYAEVGWMINGKNKTCAACRAASSAKRRKGGQHGTETHCPQGHPYVEENIYWHRRPNGALHRECKTCTRERQRVTR